MLSKNLFSMQNAYENSPWAFRSPLHGLNWRIIALKCLSMWKEYLRLPDLTPLAAKLMHPVIGWRRESEVWRGERSRVEINVRKNEEFLLLHIGRHVFSHFQESWASSFTVMTWEEKHRNSKCPLLSSSFPIFYCWEHHMIWDISLVSLQV